MNSTPFYESNDLIIRPYRQGDEASLALYSNDKLIASQMERWFPSPFTYDDACVWVSDNLQSNSNFPIIFYGDVIGNVGLRNISDNEAELVLWIGTEFWNQGIGTRASQWMKDFAKSQLNISHLTARINRDNTPALRIAGKCGFEIVAQ